MLDAEAVFKTSLTHSLQAGTRFASSVPVQIGSGNVSGLDCEGSRVLPNMLCPQHRPDPSDDISSNFTNVCLAPIPHYLRLQL